MKLHLRSLALLVSISAAAIAQVDRATITGTIHDPSGAVVPDGKVAVRFAATGATRSTVSNGPGVFLIAGLAVGHVVIQVDKPGFRAIRANRW